jgi:hypothetical protein
LIRKRIPPPGNLRDLASGINIAPPESLPTLKPI